MKKLTYEDEQFSIMWVMIICTFYLPVIFLFFHFYNTDEFEIESTIFLSIWVLFVTFFLYLYLRKPIKTRNKNKKIMNNGTKYVGYIEKFNYETYIKSNSMGLDNAPDYRIYKDFTLLVSYDKDGKKEEFTTPVLNFNPIKDLGSRNCNVYVYNDEVYVTDFENNTDEFNHIWSDDSEELQEVKEKDNQVKEEYKGITKLNITIAIIFVIICIILGLIAGLLS